MTDFAVVSAALATAGPKMGTAATEVAAAQHATVVRRIATAMPGSASGPAAQQCGTRWTEVQEAWSSAASDHGEALTNSAQAYDRADEAAAEQFWVEG